MFPDMGSVAAWTQNVTVTISSDVLNPNLVQLAIDAGYVPGLTGQVTYVVNSGRYIGSSNTSTPAFDLGALDFPAEVIVRLEINGFIYGKGGKGGNGQNFSPSPGIPAQNGLPGGTAIRVRRNIVIDNNGDIGGGGGGGAGAENIDNPAQGGGGGGMGYEGGAAGTGGDIDINNNGEVGTKLAAGNGAGDAGNGGSVGVDGQNSSARSGGAAGAAIDGDSYITWESLGNRYGDIIS